MPLDLKDFELTYVKDYARSRSSLQLVTVNFLPFGFLAALFMNPDELIGPNWILQAVLAVVTFLVIAFFGNLYVEKQLLKVAYAALERADFTLNDPGRTE